MTTAKLRWARRCGFLFACGLLAMSGCGKPAPAKRATVSGKVMLGGKPVTSGRITFLPDTEKGNNANVVCLGLIGPLGDYELKTSGEKSTEGIPGVPLGWYKVVYRPDRTGPPTEVNAAFLKRPTTPLSREVVAEPKPGQYDITLE